MRIRMIISAGLLLVGVLLIAAQCPNSDSYIVVLTANPTSGVSPLTVAFDASSSVVPDDSIILYEWSFGDGGTGTGETVSHTYTQPGAYTAELTARDTRGNVDSASCTIQVSAAPLANNPPTASFTASPTSGQTPLTVSFNASGSSDSDGLITSYAWSFGDGGTAAGVTASHTYSNAGTYTAQLTVADDDGATNSISQTIQVPAQAVSPPPATPNCQAGTAYLASDGLTVTLHSCVVVEKSGSYEYRIEYTLANNTSGQAIDEGTFKMYYENEAGGLPQYGFFGTLFPGDTMDRTYTFEELKTKPFDLLEYHHDHFFTQSPLQDSLRWPVVLP